MLALTLLLGHNFHPGGKDSDCDMVSVLHKLSLVVETFDCSVASAVGILLSTVVAVMGFPKETLRGWRFLALDCTTSKFGTLLVN